MERPFAWLCSLRPSDAAAHTLAQLGPSLPQAQRTALEGLRVCASRKNLVFVYLAAGYERRLWVSCLCGATYRRCPYVP